MANYPYQDNNNRRPLNSDESPYRSDRLDFGLTPPMELPPYAYSSYSDYQKYREYREQQAQRSYSDYPGAPDSSYPIQFGNAPHPSRTSSFGAAPRTAVPLQYGVPANSSRSNHGGPPRSMLPIQFEGAPVAPVSVQFGRATRSLGSLQYGGIPITAPQTHYTPAPPQTDDPPPKKKAVNRSPVPKYNQTPEKPEKTSRPREDVSPERSESASDFSGQYTYSEAAKRMPGKDSSAPNPPLSTPGSYPGEKYAAAPPPSYHGSMTYAQGIAQPGRYTEQRVPANTSPQSYPGQSAYAAAAYPPPSNRPDQTAGYSRTPPPGYPGQYLYDTEKQTPFVSTPSSFPGEKFKEPPRSYPGRSAYEKSAFPPPSARSRQQAFTEEANTLRPYHTQGAASGNSQAYGAAVNLSPKPSMAVQHGGAYRPEQFDGAYSPKLSFGGRSGRVASLDFGGASVTAPQTQFSFPRLVNKKTNADLPGSTTGQSVSPIADNVQNDMPASVPSATNETAQSTDNISVDAPVSASGYAGEKKLKSESDIPDIKAPVPELDLPEEKTSVPDLGLPEEKIPESDLDLFEEKATVPDNGLPEERISVPDLDLFEEKATVPDNGLPEEKISESDLDLPEEKVFVQGLDSPEENFSAAESVVGDEKSPASESDAAEQITTELKIDIPEQKLPEPELDITEKDLPQSKSDIESNKPHETEPKTPNRVNPVPKPQAVQKKKPERPEKNLRPQNKKPQPQRPGAQNANAPKANIRPGSEQKDHLSTRLSKMHKVQPSERQGSAPKKTEDKSKSQGRAASSHRYTSTAHNNSSPRMSDSSGNMSVIKFEGSPFAEGGAAPGEAPREPSGSPLAPVRSGNRPSAAKNAASGKTDSARSEVVAEKLRQKRSDNGNAKKLNADSEKKTAQNVGTATTNSQKKKNNFPIIVGSVAAVVFVAFMIAKPPGVKSVNIADVSRVMTINETQAAAVEILPERAAKREHEWETTDPSVAYVENDEIKAAGEGECDITLTVGGKTDSVHLSVVPRAETIAMSKRDCSLVVGETRSVECEITPPEAAKAQTVFSSSDSNIVKAGNNSLSAVAEGECSVTVTVGDKSETFAVHVYSPADGMELDSEEYALTVGEKRQIGYTLTPEGAQGRIPDFTSTNSIVADVKDGVIEAAGAGECAIEAEIDGIRKTISVTVYPAPEKIDIPENKLFMEIGDVHKVKYEVTPPEAASAPIVWKSDNESVAVVDEKGTVIAAGGGSTTITASCGNIKEIITVVVKSEETSTANKKIVGAWNARYFKNPDSDTPVPVTDKESRINIRDDGSCELYLADDIYTGSWVYDSTPDNQCYWFDFDGGYNTVYGEITEPGGLTEALYMYFADSETEKGYGMVYEKI